MSVDDYELGAALACAGARVAGRDETRMAVFATANPADTEQLGKAFGPVVERMVGLLADAAAVLAALPPAELDALMAGFQRGETK